jgi:AraC-like DNA-binding protein
MVKIASMVPGDSANMHGADPAPLAFFQLIARRFGSDAALRDAILDGTGVSAAGLDDPRTEISFVQQLRQVDNMNRLFGEGWLLDAPEIWNTATRAPLGVAVVTSATVAEALEVVSRHLSDALPRQRVSLVRSAGATTLRLNSPAELTDSQRRFTVTGVMLGLGAMFGDLVGLERSALRLEFQWGEPSWGAKLAAALGCETGWNAGANALLVPVRLLQIRSPLADPALHEVALASLESRKRSAADGMRAQTERLLAKSESGRLSSSEAARALGLSLRTLVRRLSDEGAQYRDLVDAELKSRAQRFLDAGVLTRSEIAARLGFADSSGLSRACRRWFREAG